MGERDLFKWSILNIHAGIAMISFSKEGFDEASKKWKFLKIKGHGALFARLQGFGDGYKGGGAYLLKIQYL